MSRRLRWLAVLVPTAVVVVVAVALDSALDVVFPYPHNIIVIATAAFACSAILLHFAFRRIDALTAALRAQNADLAARNARAAALHGVGLAIAALDDIDEVLDAVVSCARDVMSADVALLVLSTDGARPVLRAWRGPAGCIPAAEGGAWRADDPSAIVRPDLAASRLVAPLRSGGVDVGALAVTSASGRPFMPDDADTLASLATQAAIALEKAGLQERLRETAVVAERERIAGEMHDGLAQVLGYVNTKSQAATELLEVGRVDDARVQLDELAAAARSVYVDVRETIVALRAPIPPGTGLVAAVEDLGRRFGEASKIAVSVEASDPSVATRLGADAEAQVFRIVREALTNVRKHAAAHRVRIAFDEADDGLIVTVRDDGRGMGAAGHATARDWPRYGVDSMRERAAAVGGTVAWSTPAAGGTEVRIVVPAREAAGSPG